ncbi:MAG: tetrahydrofolate dehydrogenase/cyclohydrolase catalytic domain-containing protein, partial [Phycisphaerales bacterium JB038]
MTATIIDGKALAATYRDRAAQKVADLTKRGHSVRLDAVLAVGDAHASSRVYAEKQAAGCQDLGIDYRLHELPGDANFDDVAGRVLLLNADEEVRAIMVHLPLPDGVD